MYIKPYNTQFHVFSHSIDNYFTNKKEALENANILFQKYNSVRVYQQTEWDYEDGIFLDGNCILSKGIFPY